MELLLIRAVRSPDLPVELGGARFDMKMSGPSILNVPVEKGLKLTTAICSDRMNPEGELLQHVVNEVDCVLLGVSPVDLDCVTLSLTGNISIDKVLLILERSMNQPF